MQKPELHTTDPLAIAIRYKAELAAELTEAVSHVGTDVIVGHGVTLWGGRPGTCTGIELHDGVRLYDGCRLVVDAILPESGIVLRERVAANFNVYIDGSGGVEIGAGTIIGPNVVIVSSGHVISDEPIQTSGKRFARVEVGEGVWIGANAVILSGVTIGDGAVVGAGSVVTRSVEAGARVAGNPARPIRQSGAEGASSQQIPFVPGLPLAHPRGPQ